MAKIVKTSDMKGSIIAFIVAGMNVGSVMQWHGCLLTDTEPKDLYYPEGWYYSKGNLRNVNKMKYLICGKVPMLMNSGISWQEFAPYSTENDHMTKRRPMSYLSENVIADIFKILNYGDVELNHGDMGAIIVTDVEPKWLVYPQGWHYENGCLCNKLEAGNTIYREVPMTMSSGTSWRTFATYSVACEND